MREIVPLRAKPETGSLSPDRGSTAPILRGTTFLDTHGCVDHLELILNREVLALVGNHTDDRPSGALLSPVHQLFQFLLAGFTTVRLAAICWQEWNSNWPASAENPPVSGFESSDAHAAKSTGKINVASGVIRMGSGMASGFVKNGHLRN
jgi:hypothetical protein